MASETRRASLKRDYLWNTASSLMNAAATVIMGMAVARMGTLEAAGVFSLALAMGQQFQTLGAYEVRTYQATDLRDGLPFGVYLSTRYLTVALMLLGIFGAVLASPSARGSALVVVLIASLKCFEAFEDVIYTEFQRVGLLHVGARACFWRMLLTTVAFCAGLALGHSLWLGAVAGLLTAAVTTLALYIPAMRGVLPWRPQWSRSQMKRLLIDCLPLFLGSFIATYLANAPKYAIDLYLGEAQQGYFLILFMPAMVVNLVSLMVFRPLLTTMAQRWTSGDLTAFKAIIRRGLLTVGLASVVVAVVTYLIGAPLLGAVFGKDVSAFVPELMVLVAGGALNAASVILYYALTTMRLQRLVFIGYVVCALVSTGAMALLVPAGGLMGACMGYALTMAALVFAFLTGIWYTRKGRR
ncbi:Uncharacterised protein [Actinomyces bovis]|uniref:Polysaccharide biosynthesis protein n=1 Tax=Actinomyces bovis TaxID=1658 RepID=A0ABY1VMJ5_9ACTO|nr:lipopolysaccharide biosynthesis protein [Actinomyces bovis]SPT53310.1 Uncharacterised protein [Actinomyces bovis]VEG52638.1 Uncharacterised protein [Actinomyces israelii]